MSERGRGPEDGYRMAVRAFSVTIIGFGVVILGLTFSRGGGPTSAGFIFGLLFIGLGIGRLYISSRR
jgi:hypothetical protein